ncbi:MAG: hypothetical protein ACYYKD_02700 [Rhodospirillales bacterium]
MSDVSRIVSGDVLRTAQAARHNTPPQRAQGPAHAENRGLAPVKNPPPAPGSGTPVRGAPRGAHIDILV